MDLLKPTDLKSLIAQQGKWSVSLYMPREQIGKDQPQNAVRLKNLLAEAETKLLANGLHRPRVQKLMRPAEELLWNTDFWHIQSDGLAIFLSNDFHAIYRLPAAFDELLVIANTFHVKPLFPLLRRAEKFYLLTISLNHVRLFQSNVGAMAELELNVPANLEAGLHMNEPQRFAGLQSDSVSRKEARDGAETDHSGADEPDRNILRFLRSINDRVNVLIEDKDVPVVLAGVDRLVSLYREANTYTNLLKEAVIGDPDRENLPGLRAQAWNLVQPIFEENQKKALEKYRQLQRQQSDLATNDLTTAVKAARLGQVEALFVPLGEQIWGQYDEEQNKVVLASGPGPENEDLLDFAASETLLNSGQVFTIPHKQFPGGGDLAAILRYAVPGM